MPSRRCGTSGGERRGVPHQDEEFEETPKEIDRAAPPKPLSQSNTLKGVATGRGDPRRRPRARSSRRRMMRRAMRRRRSRSASPRWSTAPATSSTRSKPCTRTCRVPEGFWLKAAHLATDPVVLAIFGTLAIAGSRSSRFERWRKHRLRGRVMGAFFAFALSPIGRLLLTAALMFSLGALPASRREGFQRLRAGSRRRRPRRTRRSARSRRASRSRTPPPPKISARGRGRGANASTPKERAKDAEARIANTPAFDAADTERLRDLWRSRSSRARKALSCRRSRRTSRSASGATCRSRRPGRRASASSIG
jgi:hypothetical protein